MFASFAAGHMHRPGAWGRPAFQGRRKGHPPSESALLSFWGAGKTFFPRRHGLVHGRVVRTVPIPVAHSSSTTTGGIPPCRPLWRSMERVVSKKHLSSATVLSTKLRFWLKVIFPTHKVKTGPCLDLRRGIAIERGALGRLNSRDNGKEVFILPVYPLRVLQLCN